MGERDKFGHRPFERLKSLTPAARRAASTSQARPPTPRPSDETDEGLLFAQAMHDVARLPGDPAPLPPDHGARLPDPEAEDREVTARLTALVRGELRFDISDTDEFIEGAATDLDKRIRAQLRRGEFAIQAHLDLHGLTREEARPALETFMREQRLRGRRCVLVIHGRGLNSKGQVPVLKEQMGRWLSRGELGKRVLAFCTARPVDGGAGAVYVLLRR